LPRIRNSLANDVLCRSFLCIFFSGPLDTVSERSSETRPIRHKHILCKDLCVFSARRWGAAARPHCRPGCAAGGVRVWRPQALASKEGSPGPFPAHGSPWVAEHARRDTLDGGADRFPGRGVRAMFADLTARRLCTGREQRGPAAADSRSVSLTRTGGRGRLRVVSV
jgi:hypothetical protein